VTAEDFLPGVVWDVRLLSPEPAYTNVPRLPRVEIIVSPWKTELLELAPEAGPQRLPRARKPHAFYAEV